MAGRREVAELAGVTPAVVSYVTNGSHPVNAQTRARVEAAIEKLGYRPNAVARSLAKQQSNTIGLLLPDSSNPYFAELSSAIEHAAYEAGYAVLLGNGSEDEDRELAYVRSFLDQRVAGVIVCPSSDESHSFDELVKAGVAVVTTDRFSHDPAMASVSVDNGAGARVAVEHLVQHGRTRIACVGGSTGASSARDRVQGWRDVLADSGLAEPAPVAYADFTAEAGRAVTESLLRSQPDIDALFVASDVQALGALRALADLGLRAGADVAVVGFDGISLGAYLTPALTTIAQPFTDIADAVVSGLLGHLGSSARQASAPADWGRVLPPALVVRESCGCPSSAHP